MHVLAIVHQRSAGPGVFGEAIRDAGHELDTWPIAESPAPPSDPHGFDAVVTFGGSMDAHEEDRHPWLRGEKELLAELLDRGRPLMGVCLGSQLLAEAAGAAPQRSSEPENGWHRVGLTAAGAEDPMLAPLAPGFAAFMWHSYEAPLPPGATALARSDVCLHAYRIGDGGYGIQFHAEVSAGGAQRWIDDYRSDPDAVRTGVNPDALRKDTRVAIESWNELGRGLCGRFLETVAGR
ncbi:MAG: type 1 glutamine amidotransferase [Solirubrobacterales bacterium]